MLVGANWRREQDWEVAAWVTAHLLNVSGKAMKQRITAKDLLGKNIRRTPGDVQSDFRELMRRVDEAAK